MERRNTKARSAAAGKNVCMIAAIVFFIVIVMVGICQLSAQRSNLDHELKSTFSSFGK